MEINNCNANWDNVPVDTKVIVTGEESIRFYGARND